MKSAPPSEPADPLGSAACNGWRGLVGDLSPFAFHRGLVILALLGLIVRVGFFIEHAQTPSFGVPTLDQLYYDTVARMLQSGHDLHALHGFRPLLYPIFLAGCYATAGTGGITFALLLQHVLGVATGLLVALLGARLYCHRLAHAPEDAALWNNLGAALDALGRTDAALASYRRSLACQPPSANACLGAALIELRKGDLEAAAALLDQYEKGDSAPSAIARACRAVLERRRGNLPRAEAFEQDARRLDATAAAGPWSAQPLAGESRTTLATSAPRRRCAGGPAASRGARPG